MSTKKVSQLTAITTASFTTAAKIMVVSAAGNSNSATISQTQVAMSLITALTGDVTATGAGGSAAATIGARKVLASMMPSITAARLMGRRSASAGDYDEIQVGANLQLSGSTLAVVSVATLPIATSDVTGLDAALAQLTPVTLTADVTLTASTAFANVTGAALSVSANTKYFFEWFIVWQSSDTGTGPAFAITAPSSPTSLTYQSEIRNTTTQGTSGVSTELGTANDGTSTALTSVDSANANRLARVWGILNNGSNAGSIQLRLKANQTNGAITLIVKAATFGRKSTL